MMDNILLIASIIVSSIAIVISLRTIISTRQRYYNEYLSRKRRGYGRKA